MDAIKSALQDKLKGTKAGFRGFSVSGHVEDENNSSRLVVEAKAVGWVDFPGDAIEHGLATVMGVLGLGNSSTPSGE